MPLRLRALVARLCGIRGSAVAAKKVNLPRRLQAALHRAGQRERRLRHTAAGSQACVQRGQQRRASSGARRACLGDA